ncbi:hypothetical protein KKF91_12835, partial [Myxococcota bacterium]|nr:hypothetical protein [Myxococcota bacterium]
KVHTSSPDLRKAWLVAYRLFCEMWRAALEKFTLGVATSLPEEGCRPPWLPYTRPVSTQA